MKMEKEMGGALLREESKRVTGLQMDQWV